MRLSDGGSGGGPTEYDKYWLRQVVMSTWTAWEGDSQYRYTKYMDEQTGRTRLSKVKISSRSTTVHHHTASSSSSRSSTPPKKYTKPASVPKAKPKPKAPPKPSTVAKPGSFSKKKPTAPSAFKWTKPQPVHKEILIPAKPLDPGEAPKFNLEKQKSITKYEYLMGIKDLSIKHKQYGNKAIFVSKPMEVDGNVMQVSLHAIEEHPLFDEISGAAADRQTSIEYYIAYSENPTPDEWHPVLPEDQMTIQAELVIFDTARTAMLRFPALITSKEEPKLYRDGLFVDKTLWSFADGGTKIQLLTTYEPTSTYTISYTPNSEFYNPWTLNIKETGIVTRKQVDSFPAGTNHNKTVVLSQYPYVDYEKINTDSSYDSNTSDYKPIQVTLKNAQIAGTNRAIFKEALPYDGEVSPFTKNMTDYKHGIARELTSYSIDSKNGIPYFGFEYMQDGNKLYFTETFNNTDIYTNAETNHGNAEIQVEYEYMVSNFRIKIILRRNSSDTNTLTPIVHEYALKFKVMK